MFAHIRQHVPQATAVRGNSWLYNLEAYRRLYPPAYTAVLPESAEGEFQSAVGGAPAARQQLSRTAVGAHASRRSALLLPIPDPATALPYHALLRLLPGGWHSG
jgi:hypothetical protein